MIVITTPTGDIGARVLDLVLKSDRDVRVIVRDAGRLPENFRTKVDVVEGSHADADIIVPALVGATRVFWLPPGSPRSENADAAYVAFSQAFCAALPTSDVTHVVGVSALGRGWHKPAGHVTASLKMDDMIGATGVHYRALSCASLMDNIARQAGPIGETGTFYQPTPGDLKLPHVAKADVAAVAAKLLLAPGWHGVDEVPLLGPRDLCLDEMATVLSEVLGRDIRFQEIPMDGFEAMMRDTGASAGMARSMVQMFTAKNEGMDNMIKPSDRTDTPTTFREWCTSELRPMIAT